MEKSTLIGCCKQCDQIRRFFALWATIQSLWQQLYYPNCPHCWAIFVKVPKSFIFLVKSYLGNFNRHLAIFIWSHLQVMWLVFTNYSDLFQSWEGILVWYLLMTLAPRQVMKKVKVSTPSDPPLVPNRLELNWSFTYLIFAPSV